MARKEGFIAKHNLWSADQIQRANELKARIKKGKIELFGSPGRIRTAFRAQKPSRYRHS